jgi:hypothetical protein
MWGNLLNTSLTWDSDLLLSDAYQASYMDIVARYKQVFESYFRRAIQGSCHLHPEHYRDIFVVHFRDTIQVLESSWCQLPGFGCAELDSPLLFFGLSA